MPEVTVTALVSQLVSSNDATFYSGLRAAVEAVQQGDRTGLLAIRQAVVQRS